MDGLVLPCPGVMHVAHEGARTIGFIRYGPYWPAALRLQVYFCYADAASLRGPV